MLPKMKCCDEEESSELGPKSSFLDKEGFTSEYTVLKTIGCGAFAQVKLAHHRLTGAPVAVKVLRKKKVWRSLVRSEVDIMRTINHPNVVSLYQVIESPKRVYLIMELVEGQELYGYVRKAGRLQDNDARGIFRQVLSAVSYCHQLGIIHRDLKPDNILLGRNGKVKIIDFGFGTRIKPGEKLSFFCGSYAFGAPELLLGRLYDGPKVDVWILGVVLYFMVVGKLPFRALILLDLERQILEGKYTVPLGLSEELRDLLRLLMTVNPRLRPRVDQVMTHPWLSKDTEALPDACEEVVPSLPDPAIVEAMEHIGFQAQDIEDALRQRKFDQIMATYCLLQGQALQGQSCTTSAQPTNPVVALSPSLEDLVALPLAPRRRRSEPALGTSLRGSSTSSQPMVICQWPAYRSSAYGQQAAQRGDRRATEPALPLCRPLQRTPTFDHLCSKSAPCIYFTSGSSENTEGDLGSHSASAEDKSTHSRGQRRGWRGWTRRIGNTLMGLCCCCFPSRNRPRRGQNRVSPQK